MTGIEGKVNIIQRIREERKREYPYRFGPNGNKGCGYNKKSFKNTRITDPLFYHLMLDMKYQK